MTGGGGLVRVRLTSQYTQIGSSQQFVLPFLPKRKLNMRLPVGDLPGSESLSACRLVCRTTNAAEPHLLIPLYPGRFRMRVYRSVHSSLSRPSSGLYPCSVSAKVITSRSPTSVVHKSVHVRQRIRHSHLYLLGS
jgi:hypothetical protein